MSWHAVDVAGLEPGQSRAVEVGGRSLLVCHAEGRYYAIDDECPHAGIPLEGGSLRGCIFQCPLHGGRLDVRDGSPVAVPISRPVPTYPVREAPDGAEIEIEIPAEDP